MGTISSATSPPRPAGGTADGSCGLAPVVTIRGETAGEQERSRSTNSVGAGRRDRSRSERSTRRDVGAGLGKHGVEDDAHLSSARRRSPASISPGAPGSHPARMVAGPRSGGARGRRSENAGRGACKTSRPECASDWRARSPWLPARCREPGQRRSRTGTWRATGDRGIRGTPAALRPVSPALRAAGPRPSRIIRATMRMWR